jgi:hypothetical protein
VELFDKKKQMRKYYSKLLVSIILAGVCCLSGFAQNNGITGVVTDAKTGMPIAYAAVHYQGRTVGTTTDYDGKYSVPKINGAVLDFTCLGYSRQSVKITSDKQKLDVRLKVVENVLEAATVKVKKQKYSRKENPAVELMRKVIAAKKESDLHRHDYFSYDKYQKMTFAVNEFTEKVYSDANFKNMPFLKNHVETCPETGKLILPVSVQETMSKHVFRKTPTSEKDIITGQREEGVNQLINTGDILNTLLQDCFTDVDLYKENVRLLQYPFISPISTHLAIGFYRYFIADTVMVDKDRCIEVTLTPNNPQDFGFMGSLFIIDDGTYRLRRASLEIPRRSDVNFIEHLSIDQDFTTLPSGEQVLHSDKMTVQIKLANFLTKFQVQRSTYYSDYSLDEIPKSQFKFAGPQMTDPNAMMRDEVFWNSKRPVKLSQSEDEIGGLVKSMESLKNFKFFLFVAKAFIENFVETTTKPEKPSKIDIGPVNTIVSQNYIDGLRLRLSAQTTANLDKHLFGKGYLAYGFDDQRWKGMGEVTYSFNEKAYLPREYPMHNLIVGYQTDVMSPSDKFLPTDKDNVFTSFKFTKVDQMMYFKRLKLEYQKEWMFGLRFEAEFNRERDEACGRLFYQPLDGFGAPSQDATKYQKYLNTSSLTLGVHFQPGVTYINTKQRRIELNRDAPIMSLNHTLGLGGFMGGDYKYNFTEGHIYQRIWVPSAGKIDIHLKGGVEWNRVPFPLLIMPAADLSYVIEDETFSMLNNMEFLNDRYASLMASWDLNGKVFNRIPLLKKLKWREYIGVNMLWGTLSDKNNPFKNPTDSRLFYFPGHFMNDGDYEYSSTVMNEKKPYYELIFGIHNIFKVIHVEMVRRMNYLEDPRAKKWGFRFMFRMTF